MIQFIVRCGWGCGPMSCLRQVKDDDIRSAWKSYSSAKGEHVISAGIKGITYSHFDVPNQTTLIVAPGCPVLSYHPRGSSNSPSRLMIPIIKIFLRKTSLGKIISKKWWWQKLTNQRNSILPQGFLQQVSLGPPTPKILPLCDISSTGEGSVLSLKTPRGRWTVKCCRMGWVESGFVDKTGCQNYFRKVFTKQ